MNKYIERIYNGAIRENPTFVLMLGMCPTLAVTKSASGGLYMGLATTVVLILSNMMISALRKIIPDKVRIPAYIVVVASFVTAVQLIIQAYLPAIQDLLGVYIPLIVVNCIILGRAEAYANKNSVGLSAFDGIGMGIGFTVALTIIGLVREFLGDGTVFGQALSFMQDYKVSIFTAAPGAFFVLALLTGLQNKLKAPSATNVDRGNGDIACGGNCSGCSGAVCASNKGLIEAEKAAAKAEKLAKAKAAAEAKKAAAKNGNVAGKED